MGNRNMWKGDFESLKRHFHIQFSETTLIGDIQTKCLKSNTTLLDLIDNFYPLARSKGKVTKPFNIFRIVVQTWLHYSLNDREV